MPIVEYRRDSGAIMLVWALPAMAGAVWRHLTSERYLPEWLGHRTSGEVAEAQTLVVDHGDGYLCTSRIDTVEPGRRLAMSWEFDDEPPSRLDLSLESLADEINDPCRLHLRHTQLGDLTASYLPGWITHLTYLEASVRADPLPLSAFWSLYETHQLLVGPA